MAAGLVKRFGWASFWTAAGTVFFIGLANGFYREQFTQCSAAANVKALGYDTNDAAVCIVAYGLAVLSIALAAGIAAGAGADWSWANGATQAISSRDVSQLGASYTNATMVYDSVHSDYFVEQAHALLGTYVSNITFTSEYVSSDTESLRRRSLNSTDYEPFYAWSINAGEHSISTLVSKTHLPAALEAMRDHMDGTKGLRKRSGGEWALYTSLGTSGHWGPGMRDNEQEKTGRQ